MDSNGIDDQNNNDIIDEPQDILEEYVENGVDNNNEVVHISPVYYDKKPIIWLFWKKPKIWL